MNVTSIDLRSAPVSTVMTTEATSQQRLEHLESDTSTSSILIWQHTSVFAERQGSCFEP